MSNLANDPETNATTKFMIQKIYLKDSSFEAPHTPKIFQHDWEPELSLDLHCANCCLANEIYEVVLTLIAKVVNKTMLAFLVEVNQAGIFQIAGINQEQLGHMLGCFCPNILFPYARQIITSQVAEGGFPQLILAPINFDALYQQQMVNASQLLTEASP